MADYENEEGASPRRRPHQEWPASPVLPPNPTITLRFHGLLSFCYNRQRKDCEVGVFNKRFAPDHRLRIQIKHGAGNWYDVQNPPTSGDYSFEVVNTAPRVLAYQKPGAFDRQDDQNTDPHDFRWLLDIEGPDFYDKPVPSKVPGYYDPKLYVKNGIFNTYMTTNSRFLRVNACYPSDPTYWTELGSIAYYTAAHVYMIPNQQAKLSIPGRNPITFESSMQHSIYFTNDCSGEGVGRSDFFHHFHSFVAPDGMDRYDLQVYETPVGGSDTTDEAPCGGAGYGGSGGHP